MKYIHLITSLLLSIQLAAQITETPEGNVGIGTDNPQNRKLQVNANSDQDIALRLQIGKFSMGGAAPFEIDAPGVLGGRMTIAENGHIGVGTANPGVKLEVRNGEILVGDSNGGKGTLLFGNINHGIQRVSNEIQLFTAGGAESGFAFLNAGHTGTREVQMKITHTGNVGIGTTTPSHKLEVNGTVRAKEIRCEAAPWPDYVFEESYELPSIESVEQYIKSKGHLPEMPTAEEVAADGVALGEMNRLLLQKVEELTLYTIEQEKRLKKQEVLEKQVEALLKRVAQLESK